MKECLGNYGVGGGGRYTKVDLKCIDIEHVELVHPTQV